MNNEITFYASGIPIPHVYSVVSYEIKEDNGYIHFNGWYPVAEKKEPTGTELDDYEYIFTLPKQMYMIIKVYTETDHIIYIPYKIEVYERIIYLDDPDTDSYMSTGTEQRIDFRILKTI